MAHTIPKIHIFSNKSFRYESHIFGKPPKNIFRVTLFLQIRVGFPVYKYVSEIQIRQKLDFLDSVRMAEDPY